MSTDKTNEMLVSVVLDRSGSMNSTRAGTISGYNEYINGLRADKASVYSVSLIQFDSNGFAAGPELTISYIDKPLADVPTLTESDYEPRGGTPLYDAIGECVRRAEPIKGTRAVTVVIITDGQENASKEFTRDSIKALIKSKEAEGWTFAFLGADIDSYAVTSGLGMSAGNTSNYAKGMEHALYTNSARATVTRSHSNASVGVHASSLMAFFGDDQKAAMGDTTVKGGPQAGPATFHPHTISTGIDPKTKTVDRPKRREWKSTTGVSK